MGPGVGLPAANTLPSRWLSPWWGPSASREGSATSAWQQAGCRQASRVEEETKEGLFPGQRCLWQLHLKGRLDSCVYYYFILKEGVH